MSETPKNQAQFFPQPYPSAPCDIYACTQRSKYFIGRPDGPLNVCLRLCPEHAAQLLANLPEEFFKLPEPQVASGTGFADLFAEIYKTLDDEGKAELLLAISNIVEADEQQDGKTDGEPPPADAKKYHCEYCGQGFDVPIEKANHLRSCQAKKEAEAREGGDG